MKKSQKMICATLALLVQMGCSKDEEAINQAPGTFTVTPTVNANSVMLSWTAAIDPEGGAVIYTVIMNGNTELTGNTETNHTIDNLMYATMYSGKVMAYDPEGLTTEANFNFDTGIRPNTAPTQAVLSSPETNGQSVTVTPELTWQAATDAEGDAIVYDVYLDESSNPGTKIAENLSATSFSVSTDLKNSTTYYWKIVARDAFDATTESATSNFTTREIATIVDATTAADFSQRSGHTSVVFNNRIWVIGGSFSGGIGLGDVWSSGDGVSWTEEIPIASIFAPRVSHASAVFNNRLWVIGGKNGASTAYNDVWSTQDGVNWIQATASANFEARFGHKVVVFNNKMWLYGGRDNDSGNFTNEVWSSDDGITWIQETDSAAPKMRAGFDVLVFDNKIWVTGGRSSENTVYVSNDGVNFTLVTDSPDYATRVFHKSVAFDNKMWIIGGKITDASSTASSEIWYSNDGEQWTLALAEGSPYAKANASAVAFDNSIYVMAGFAGGINTIGSNNVWYLNFD